MDAIAELGWLVGHFLAEAYRDSAIGHMDDRTVHPGPEPPGDRPR